MGVPYDEIYISTMREIEVCREKIKRFERVIAQMEREKGISTDEFMKNYEGGGMTGGEDERRWHESAEGLKSWKERLKEFEEILAHAGRP